VLEFAVFAILVLGTFPGIHGRAGDVRLPRVRPDLYRPVPGSASPYQYFGATVVILILVSLLPPNRPDSWLRFSDRGGSDEES
jgi:hypothetical protein